jgi:hypothetical protein
MKEIKRGTKVKRSRKKKAKKGGKHKKQRV